MLWLKPFRAALSKRVIRGLSLAVIGAAFAGLAGGCGFQPLYGPTASGANLTDVMKSVEISPLANRVGQRVRNDLIFGTRDGGYENKPVYRLDIALKESIRNTLVARTGDPQGQVYELSSEFRLVRIQDNKTVFTGVAHGSAAYDRAGTDSSVFADVRAQRDAENRAARTLSDTIKTKLAAYLSGAA